MILLTNIIQVRLGVIAQIRRPARRRGTQTHSMQVLNTVSRHDYSGSRAYARDEDLYNSAPNIILCN